jgi:DASH complex subunit DAD1
MYIPFPVPSPLPILYPYPLPCTYSCLILSRAHVPQSLEQVLQQINALNRSLEGIIEIGNEFASVEALWSQFESIMGMPDESAAGNASAGGEDDATVTVVKSSSGTQEGEGEDETETEQDETITR